jgi:hypothetical protein
LRPPSSYSPGPARSGIYRMLRLGCLGLACLIPIADAQTAPQATLHHRSSEAADNTEVPATKLISPSTIPLAASGEYLFGSDPNDVIQITLTGDALSGYISRHGQAQNDHGAPLTLFFTHTWLDGERLGFDTQEIHGVSYSFEGAVVRGSAKSTREAGYYLLQGTLIRSEAGNKQPSRVSMKLAPHS